jgi:hypothetical protein
MKQCFTRMSLALVVLLAIGGSWMSDQALAGRGGGGHPGGGGGNMGGGGGHPGGGNFSGGNFSGGAMSRPAQGHVPSFSVPSHYNQQFNNAGGQAFSQHFNSGNSPLNSLNRPGTGNNPAFNSNSINSLNRVNLGGRPTTIGNHSNNSINNNNWHGGNNNFNNNNFNNVHVGNNPVIVNKPVVGNNTNYNQHFNNNNFNNHNFNNNFANQNSWYHGHWHNNWNNAWYNRPIGWGGYGYGYGYGNGFGYGNGYGYGLAGIPYSWGYLNYYNPYYTQPVGGYAGFNYSQPIVVNTAPAVVANVAANDPQNQQPSPDDVASQLLATAREAFMRGDYAAALAQTDQAVAQLPNDPVVHEFRGLVLFALHRYQEAAAAEYGVLSVGPGWDWTTLISLYPDSDTYTGQLRALEQYTSENPRQPEARFLLAYHYMTCGHMQDAIAELKAAVQLNPKDQLSAQLLSSLTAPQNGEQPAPTQPVPAAQPIDPSTLVGSWSASRPDGSSFALNLSNENTFTWKFTQQGKTQSFTGPYTLEDNALTLKQGDTPAMVGQVTPLGQNRFNFKLMGDNPADPGLTFTR